MAAINLHLDFETRSRLDLREVGLDRYAKDPSTEVLMLAYASNDQDPQVWFPHEREIPEELLFLLKRAEVQKLAFNSEFERTIFHEILKLTIPIREWTDPAVWARYASIAGDLGFSGKIIGIAEDKAKIAGGKKLIKFFCQPNKNDEFNDWNSHPSEFAEFVNYCKHDVLAERELHHKLKAFEPPQRERKIWALDQKINDTGLPVDLDFIRGASRVVGEEQTMLLGEAKELMGLDNPNSPSQLLRWVKDQGYPYGSLGKDWVTKALDGISVTDKGRRGLELRQLLSKSSTAKLSKIAAMVSPDGRLRRQYKFYGASRTGRWSAGSADSPSAQLQNFPRGTIKEFDSAVEAIRTGEIERVRKFGHVHEVVSSCLRGAFRAEAGKQFVVCDLNAIENRVLGYISGDPEINQVFELDRCPYLSFAVHMYKQPYEVLEAEYKAGDKSKRTIGKPGSLGSGYQMSGGKEVATEEGDLIKTGLWGYAENMGVIMTQDEAHTAVKVYRETYKKVVALWRAYENAAIAAIRTGEPQKVGCITFGCVKPCKLLWILLPSGRHLFYIRPRLETEEGYDGQERVKVSYEGNLKGKTWGRKHGYGGHWTENICQAFARDVLVEAMLRAAEKRFEICGSSHDEIIALGGVGSSQNLELLRECMVEPMPWAPDLKLGADGFTDFIYRKN